MEIENHGEKVVRRYREWAIWGGVILGLFLGAIAGGPNLASWSEPIKMYAMYIFGGGFIGALAGFLFYEIFLSSLAGTAPATGIQSPDNYTGNHDASLPHAEYDGGSLDVGDDGHG